MTLKGSTLEVSMNQFLSRSQSLESFLADMQAFAANTPRLTGNQHKSLAYSLDNGAYRQAIWMAKRNYRPIHEVNAAFENARQRLEQQRTEAPCELEQIFTEIGSGRATASTLNQLGRYIANGGEPLSNQKHFSIQKHLNNGTINKTYDLTRKLGIDDAMTGEVLNKLGGVLNENKRDYLTPHGESVLENIFKEAYKDNADVSQIISALNSWATSKGEKFTEQQLARLRQYQDQNYQKNTYQRHDIKSQLILLAKQQGVDIYKVGDVLENVGQRAINGRRSRTLVQTAENPIEPQSSTGCIANRFKRGLKSMSRMYNSVRDSITKRISGSYKQVWLQDKSGMYSRLGWQRV